MTTSSYRLITHSSFKLNKLEMTITIVIGGRRYYRWSLYNWSSCRGIFYASDIIEKQVKDVIPYLDYRIQWLKAQGYDETCEEINTWGTWAKPEEHPRGETPSEHLYDPHIDFAYKSRYLSMIMYLREMCEDTHPESKVWCEDQRYDNGTNIVATREIVTQPLGAFVLDRYLRNEKTGLPSARLRRLVFSYVYSGVGPFVKSIRELTKDEAEKHVFGGARLIATVKFNKENLVNHLLDQIQKQKHDE